MNRLMMATDNLANPMQKWQVSVASTEKRRGIGGVGWSMGFLRFGETFYGEWIVNGWVKNHDAPWWVRVAHLEKITSDEVVTPPPPNTDGDALYYWLSDYALLGTKYERDRPTRLSGWPQTVRGAHKGNGSVKATDDYIALTLDRNPGMTYEILANVIDAFARKGEKWRDGDNRVPIELVFACNTFAVTRRMRNAGGLSGIPTGAWILEADVADYDNLHKYANASEIPQKYIMHFTLAKRDSPQVNPPLFMGGREIDPKQPTELILTAPFPLYFMEQVAMPVSNFQNPYNPAWTAQR